jgi:hypothetical protein
VLARMKYLAEKAKKIPELGVRQASRLFGFLPLVGRSGQALSHANTCEIVRPLLSSTGRQNTWDKA